MFSSVISFKFGKFERNGTNKMCLKIEIFLIRIYSFFVLSYLVLLK